MMRGVARGIRVQVFLGETDQVRHVPRYTALLEYLRQEGAAGATVTRGIAGFGVNSRIRTSATLSLSMDLPVILTWIDSPERVERLLPGVRERAGSGIVALDDVQIVSYGGRGVEQLRFDLAVRDVMRTDVVSVSDAAPVREAVGLLIGREFRALPVVDALGVLRGMIANTDLIEKAGLKVRLELLGAMPPDAREAVLAKMPAIRVLDVMHREPEVLKLDDTVATATKRMSELRLKRLPVVDTEGRLVGILSRADVLRAVAESFPREAPVDTSRAGALTAGELMRADAPVVQGDAPLNEVVNVVASTRLNRAIVVDAENRVLGLITDADILRSVEPAARSGVVGALMRVGGSAASKATAADVMRADSPVVEAGATLAAAAQLMVTHRRKILPVVDSERHLLGVIDRADLLHAASGALDDLGNVAAEDDED